MSIIDQVLGNSGDNAEATSDSSTFDSIFGTSPGLSLGTSDVLQSTSYSQDDDGDVSYNDFSGIGDLGVGLSAPTIFGLSSSGDNMSASQSDGDNGGGLLSGLL